LVPKGTICRAVRDAFQICDYPEFCTGSSSNVSVELPYERKQNILIFPTNCIWSIYM